MNKSEFLAQRTKQREAGQLPKPTLEVYEENTLNAYEEQRALEALGNQKAGIYRTSDLGLQALLAFVEYKGTKVTIIRKRVDELDNITICRRA